MAAPTYPEHKPAANPIKGECGFSSTALPFPLSLTPGSSLAGPISGSAIPEASFGLIDIL
jgi:hypothetical protein